MEVGQRPPEPAQHGHDADVHEGEHGVLRQREFAEVRTWEDTFEPGG